MAFSGKMSRHYTSQVLLMQNQSGHNSITVLVLHEQKHLNFFKILPIWSLWCFAWYQDYYILMFNAQMPQSHPMLSQSIVDTWRWLGKPANFKDEKQQTNMEVEHVFHPAQFF